MSQIYDVSTIMPLQNIPSQHVANRGVNSFPFRNEELSLRLRQEIERLSKMIKQPTAPGSPFRRQGEPPEMYDLRVSGSRDHSRDYL